jgi:Fe-Mn family superoxide dismutase
MTDAHIDRRGVLTLLGLGGVAAAARGEIALAPRIPGLDQRTGEYVLPPLPYPADALEPHIDARTMSIHHDIHHAGYVGGLNRALRYLGAIRDGDVEPNLLKHWVRELAFHACGHVNHVLFWECLAPPGAGGGGFPEGDLADAIERDFGSFERFAAEFAAAAESVEGSGWAFLAFEPLAARLLVHAVEKHQNQAIAGSTPLLAIDVWEHAYYLRYQNRRGDYVRAFWNVVNWPGVARRFAAATS